VTDAHYKELLTKMIVMNQQTWEALKKHGATEESQHQLDFYYYAPSREAANAMAALIRQETDYEVRVESDDSDLSGKWLVKGTTQKTTISLRILDDWVFWMVTAGRQQGCDFDGWGTEV
jgi:Regulator of ribonuclease activity B